MKKTSLQKGRWSWAVLFFLFWAAGYSTAGTTPLTAAIRPQLITQQQSVTGTVHDAQGPLPGVTVTIQGKNTATLTNDKGQFTLPAAIGEVLVFSYLGYKETSLTITGYTPVSITLQEDATALKEVTINAGYYTVKDKERTGSIARITAVDIENQPVTNVLAAMQGRMAGVNIVQTSGVPGSGFDIQIRGVNSLRADGNEPLYIVDGVPYSSQTLGNAQISGLILAGASSPLNSINPADIESIEVLKDADATAIYGSRGANGVVLITTKKGKEGKTKLSIHSYSGIGNVTRTMKMMNTAEYLSMRREAFANDGITTYPFNAYDINGFWDKNRYTDWRKELIGGTAHYNSLQAAISGGSAATQYLISGTYRKETTVFPGSDHYSRIAVQNNLNHRSNDGKFNMSLSVNYSRDKNTIRASDLTLQAYRLAPNAPALYNDDGTLNWENGTFDNPLAGSLSQYANFTSNLIANSVLSYKVLPDLEFKTSLGYNDTGLRENRTIPSTMYNPAFGITSANSVLFLNTGTRSSWIAEPQLNWSKQWLGHTFNILLGATFQTQKSDRLSLMGRGYVSDNLIQSIGAAVTVQVTENQISEYKYQAQYGRINYIFQDKYILNLTGRRDGSSRFGPGNRFANFGAVGAAWLFSKENFIKDNLSWISFGKIRASYGTAGSDQIGDYQFLDTYSISGRNYNGVTGLQPTRLFNPNFGWETNKKLELAAELGFLDEKVFLTAVWYRNRTSNQLVGIPLPATTGFPLLQANLDASIQNTGLEIEFRSVNYKNKDFSWVSAFNITLPKNKLLRFDGLEGSPYANTYIIGESVRIQKGYKYLGIDPATGTYQFEDYDNDGRITSLDRQYISDLSQKWFGGLNNQISYKNLELNFLFQFVKQNGRNYLYSTGVSGAMINMPVYALNHWPDNGVNSEIQVYTTGVNSNALNAYFRYKDSNAVISDASFIRLKSINLSYKIPSIGSGKFSGTIYLQGQNLLTFTKYKGADPENQSILYLPPLRQYTLGIQLNL